MNPQPQEILGRREASTAVPTLGWWSGDATPTTDPDEVKRWLGDLSRSFFLVRARDQWGVVSGGGWTEAAPRGVDTWPVAAWVPAGRPEDLGSRAFCEDHHLRFPYVAGAMANGIGSTEIVEAMGRAGMIGFFGAAGLSPAKVEDAIDRLEGAGAGRSFPYGFNLIHSPQEPRLEHEVVELYLRRGIDCIEASAYLDLTLPVVRYRVHGIHRSPEGRVVTPNRILAKVSRVEVATRFFSPPPERHLRELVALGDITAEQAELAGTVPMAQDVTAEADSGGHTDNRPALTLLPTLMALRDRLQDQHGYADRLRVGAAGGIATPVSTAAALSMGAAYVLTGSINQACVEAGTSDAVRTLLCAAEQADVAMAPAADMFEMGVKVQVLKRGTMFPMRAAKLYELYRAHASLEEIPAPVRATLEKSYFRAPWEEIWEQTVDYFRVRDPRQIERAAEDPKHKMALVFRWYLGQTSQWANAGEPSRQIDYQIWCGPAMPAFNEWVRSSFLEEPRHRHVVTLALNLLYGAGLVRRGAQLRAQGIELPEDWIRPQPRTASELRELLRTECQEG